MGYLYLFYDDDAYVKFFSGFCVPEIIQIGAFLTELHTHTHLTALFRDYLGKPVQKGKTNLDFTEARDTEWQ